MMTVAARCRSLPESPAHTYSRAEGASAAHPLLLHPEHTHMSTTWRSRTFLNFPPLKLATLFR